MQWFFDLLSTIGSFISDLVTNLYSFLGEINNLSSQVKDVSSNIGSTNASIVQILGAIRYIVGDVIYYAFYLSVIFGLFSMIYVLVVGMKKLIDNAKLNAFKQIDFNKLG